MFSPEIQNKETKTAETIMSELVQAMYFLDEKYRDSTSFKKGELPVSDGYESGIKKEPQTVDRAIGILSKFMSQQKAEEIFPEIVNNLEKALKGKRFDYGNAWPEEDENWQEAKTIIEKALAKD